jgi:hypothetical protein
MPGTDFYRALATLKFVRTELMHERDAHNAMKLCFEKIHKTLDMYRGHCINRIRFHLNRHHSEYLRKVRAMRVGGGSSRGGASAGHQHDRHEALKEECPLLRDTAAPAEPRRSMRVGIAQEMAAEIEHLKAVIQRKDLEIERLAMLLDDNDERSPEAAADGDERSHEVAADGDSQQLYYNNGNADKDDHGITSASSRTAAKEKQRLAKRMNPFMPSPSPSLTPSTPLSPAASDDGDD